MRPFFFLSLGGINGTRITSSVAQTLINLLSFEMSAKDSVVSQKIYCTDAACEIEGGKFCFEIKERLSFLLWTRSFYRI